MKSEKFTFLAIAVLHLVVQSTHGYSPRCCRRPEHLAAVDIHCACHHDCTMGSDIYYLEG